LEEAIREEDWVLYTETYARVLWDFAGDSVAQAVAAWLRASCEPEAMRAYYSSIHTWDVSACLSGIQAATLVLHNKRDTWQKLSAAQRIAAEVPNARLVVIDDMLFLGVPELVIDFVIGKPATPTPNRPVRTPESGLRTVLFTDLVGHTEMMSRLGDDRGRDVLREHERITRDVLKQHGGTEVKTMGDGFMASFGSVTKAIECAIALQRAFAEREGEPLSVRVGLNAGEPIEEDGDLFGATVILASRIAARAEGGEILVADTVRGLASGKGFRFIDGGEFMAKGFEEPVRVYEVSWGID
jgi:class 3 adenylate cyclase